MSEQTNTLRMIDKEFQYYLKNQEELVKKYNSKVIVIVGEKVVGVYETEAQAYIESIKLYKLGEFLIQKCSPGKDNYTQTFHSRVSFA